MAKIRKYKSFSYKNENKPWREVFREGIEKFTEACLMLKGVR